jgi:uncharacterized protein (DUF1501 family)
MSTTKVVSRRAIMSGTAALPAVAVLPAITAVTAAEPDPIMDAYDLVLADLRATHDELDQTIKALEAGETGKVAS